MKTTVQFQSYLTEYLDKFNALSSKYDRTLQHSSELELIIDDYSKFITNEMNKAAWEQLVNLESEEMNRLAADLRTKSARCVAIMEKYRARKLLLGNAEAAGYFQNIESCIEKEFGSFQVTTDSKVLMVGSGSFPMTPLLIAKRTGAEVVGLDIDDEAIELGLQVVENLGSGFKIRLEKTAVEHLDMTKEATHVIFSSTVESKYDLLDQLHSLTNDQVVVAMRYGDRLKSLFNYPMREVDGRKWKLAQTLLRPDHVFDVALYIKA